MSRFKREAVIFIVYEIDVRARVLRNTIEMSGESEHDYQHHRSRTVAKAQRDSKKYQMIERWQKCGKIGSE